MRGVAVEGGWSGGPLGVSQAGVNKKEQEAEIYSAPPTPLCARGVRTFACHAREVNSETAS